jgi:hypothetical protein
MIETSSLAIGHIVRALEAEISNQEALGRLPETDWSDGYDPNDIGIYRGMADYFRKPDAVVDHPESKSMAFTMALIPGYVRTHLNELSFEEWSALFQTYCQFEAAALHQIVVRHRVLTGNFERDLNSIVQFPVWKWHEA